MEAQTIEAAAAALRGDGKTCILLNGRALREHNLRGLGAIAEATGLPFREAHHVAGRLVRWCEERGVGFEALTLEGEPEARLLRVELDQADAQLVVNEWAGALAAGVIQRSPLGYLKTLATRYRAGEMMVRYAIESLLSLSAGRLLHCNNLPRGAWFALNRTNHRTTPPMSLASETGIVT